MVLYERFDGLDDRSRNPKLDQPVSSQRGANALVAWRAHAIGLAGRGRGLAEIVGERRPLQDLALAWALPGTDSPSAIDHQAGVDEDISFGMPAGILGYAPQCSDRREDLE
jgi:hypothetical protein